MDDFTWVPRIPGPIHTHPTWTFSIKIKLEYFFDFQYVDYNQIENNHFTKRVLFKSNYLKLQIREFRETFN